MTSDNLQQAKRIRLLSSQYSFLTGEVVMVSRSADNVVMVPGGHRIEGAEASLDVAPRLNITDGITEAEVLLQPGIFLVILADVEAISTQDGHKVFIPVMPFGEYEITAADLDGRTIDLVVKPVGSLQIRLLDKQRKPMSGVVLTLMGEEYEATHEFVTDGNGEYIFWALPEGKYAVLHHSGHRQEVQVLRNQMVRIGVTTSDGFTDN